MDLAAVFFMVACVNGAWGYPQGAPNSACQNMFPTGHKTQAQSTAAPYSITVNQTNYGGQVGVTLTALKGGYFEGVFIQVRQGSMCNNSQAVGTYALSGEAAAKLKTVNCLGGQGNAITHSSKDKKRNLTLTWIPPSQSMGTVYFIGTFVKETDEFWTEVSSPFISDPQGTADSHKKCELGGSSGRSVAQVNILWICAAVVWFLTRST